MRTEAVAAESGAAEAAAPSRAGRVLWPGLALAVAGSIAFSGKAIIVKLAYRYGVDAVTLIMYRMLFALPLFVAARLVGGARQAGADAARLAGGLGLGFSGYYLASFLDFVGLQYITASLERLILYLNPTLVLAIGVLFLKRRVDAAAADRPRGELLRRAAGVRPRGLVPGRRHRARRRPGVRQRPGLRLLHGRERRGGAGGSARCA